jgi:hypothetical protein
MSTTTTLITLPAIVPISSQKLQQVTAALGVPRNIIASDVEIQHAWEQLPRLLSQIPRQELNEQHVRMCVAVSSGLFDSAINYAWNTAIVALRSRVREFGLNVVAQINRSTFDDQKLMDLKDSELLTLCLQLNLVSEDAYFFLDQCRAVRNSFSTAHPPLGSIDADEFVVFLSRCARFALSVTQNPKGVDSSQLINAVKAGRHTPAQRDEWVQRLAGTHDQQRVALIPMLHGIYCDPASTEETRLNSLEICQALSPSFSSTVVSELVNRHSDYIADGKAAKQTASQQFFQKLNLLGLLTDAERHHLISGAASRLMQVHQGWDNFHNEPPFAARLREIALQANRPATVRVEYVHTVVACGAGNPYGISTAASPHYETMVRNFSPAEIEVMLQLPNSRNIVSERIRTAPKTKAGFVELVKLLDAQSVPSSVQQAYTQWRNA